MRKTALLEPISEPSLTSISASQPSISASILSSGAATLGGIAIVASYVMAVVRGDQPFGITHLPDITHCVLKQPERGLFLTLFMPACMLQAGSWMVGAAGTPHAKTTATWGVVSCALLILGEAVLDAHPNWTIHTIGASGFFLAAMVAQVMRSRAGAPNEEPRSLRAKRIIAGANVSIVLLDGVLALLKAPIWMANLCEWTLAVTVLLFHCTFAYDLHGATISLVMPTPPARSEAVSSTC